MKDLISGILILTLIISHFGCEGDKDTVPPEVSFSGANTYPNNCDTVYLGETFTLKAQLSDNEELVSFSVEIHNNFNHHGHTTEIENCSLDPVKDPVNPLVFQDKYTIPAGSAEYTTAVEIAISQNVDPGDYHLQVMAVDRTGWSSFTIISIKVLEK